MVDTCYFHLAVKSVYGAYQTCNILQCLSICVCARRSWRLCCFRDDAAKWYIVVEVIVCASIECTHLLCVYILLLAKYISIHACCPAVPSLQQLLSRFNCGLCYAFTCQAL
jgi:hypothetical protein